MAYDCVKLQNQGNIVSNLRLLYEMGLSAKEYADSQGYFSKRDVAEIAANALIITTGNRVGQDVINSLDEGDCEENNSALQNAKMRMQILRVLGLVSTDYDSELYAITELGRQIMPDRPNKKLLLELFMRICSASEIYDHNCDIKFLCYPGFQICYALASLDYRLSSKEMPPLMTYDISDIKSYVEDVKEFRSQNVDFCKDHPHFPRTQKGEPLSQPTNLTRTVNQILRYCGIIERKQKRFGKISYYVCTEQGKIYVDRIKSLMDTGKFQFISSTDFRKKKIGEQKQICKDGLDSILYLADIIPNADNSNIVFSPFQMIPETNVNWLFGREVRKHPDEKDSRIAALNSEIMLRDLRLEARYKEVSANLQNLPSEDDRLVDRIAKAKDDSKDFSIFVNELCEEVKYTDKTIFYPFVHSLLRIIGLDCRGEVGRFDAYSTLKGHIIPAEIKSYTETPNYNLKGVRQAVENKILVYNSNIENDLSYSSLVIGYNHPSNDTEILRTLIDNAHERLGINIIATDIYSLVSIVVKMIWDGVSLDLEQLLSSYGILNH